MTLETIWRDLIGRQLLFEVERDNDGNIKHVNILTQKEFTVQSPKIEIPPTILTLSQQRLLELEKTLFPHDVLEDAEGVALVDTRDSRIIRNTWRQLRRQHD